MEKFNSEWKKQMLENEQNANIITQKERQIVNLENQKKSLDTELQKRLEEIEELRQELKASKV